MKTILILSVLCFSLSLSQGCKKDSSTATSTTPTKTDLLTGSTWKVQTVTLNGVAQPLTAEQQNVRVLFARNGTGTVTGYGIPSAIWAFMNNESQIFIQVNTGNNSVIQNTFNIVSLSQGVVTVNITLVSNGQTQLWQLTAVAA
jgi:hypothetical protein